MRNTSRSKTPYQKTYFRSPYELLTTSLGSSLDVAGLLRQSPLNVCQSGLLSSDIFAMRILFEVNEVGGQTGLEAPV